MALRNKLLGTDQSVYNRFNSPGSVSIPSFGDPGLVSSFGPEPTSSLGPGPVSSFDPFFNRDNPQVMQSPSNPSLSPIVPTKSIPDWFGGPRGQGLEPAGTPQPLRGLASIPKDVLSQLTKADIPELPFNLLTGEISATPQHDMGFTTVHPGASPEMSLPLDFQGPQWTQISGGESPAWQNSLTGYVGPLPDPNFDPGLGSFKSSARNDFLQTGGGSTFNLLPAGLFGNPETAFESLKGFQQDVSSPFDVLGSLLGGIGGIAGGFPGIAGLLAGNVSGNSLAGTGTSLGGKLLAGLL